MKIFQTTLYLFATVGALVHQTNTLPVGNVACYQKECVEKERVG